MNELPKTDAEWRRLAESVIDEKTKSYVEAARQMARFVHRATTPSGKRTATMLVEEILADLSPDEHPEAKERATLALSRAVTLVVLDARRRFREQGDSLMQARSRAVDMVAHALGEADDFEEKNP